MLRLDPNDGSVIAWGWEALATLRKGSGVTIERDFKRNLGESETANQMVRLYMESLNQSIRNRKGRIAKLTDEEFLTAIGVPGNWDASQSELLKKIAEDAGFPDVRIVPEPVAAMHNLRCQALRKFKFGDKPETFMVIDFGGGTLDICIVKTQELGRNPQVLSVDGDPKLGGIDFDDLIEKWFLRQRELNREDLSPYDQATLREQVQNAKENMSGVFRKSEGDVVFKWTFHLDPGDLVFEAAKSIFEERCRQAGYLEKISEAVKRALRKCGLQTTDIKRVILTGGSSDWYFVSQIVAKQMGLGDLGELLGTESPYTDVACGLAICYGRSDEPPSKPGMWLKCKLPGVAQKDDLKILVSPGRTNLISNDRLFLGEIRGSRLLKSHTMEFEWFHGDSVLKAVSIGKSVLNAFLRANHPKLQKLKNVYQVIRERDAKHRPDTYRVYMVTNEDAWGGLNYYVEVQDNWNHIQKFIIGPSNEKVGRRFFGLGRTVRIGLHSNEDEEKRSEIQVASGSEPSGPAPATVDSENCAEDQSKQTLQ